MTPDQKQSFADDHSARTAIPCYRHPLLDVASWRSMNKPLRAKIAAAPLSIESQLEASSRQHRASTENRIAVSLQGAMSWMVAAYGDAAAAQPPWRFDYLRGFLTTFAQPVGPSGQKKTQGALANYHLAFTFAESTLPLEQRITRSWEYTEMYAALRRSLPASRGLAAGAFTEVELMDFCGRCYARRREFGYKVMISCAFLLRHSETCAICVGDLDSELIEGQRCLALSMYMTKTQQYIKAIKLWHPSDAEILDWANGKGPRGTHLFVDILHAFDAQKRASTREFQDVAYNEMGLSPDRHLSWHSLRVSGATIGYQKGLSDSEIKVLGRWSSWVFTRYVRVRALDVAKKVGPVTYFPPGREHPAAQGASDDDDEDDQEDEEEEAS
jgi:hypothetical protein